MMLVLRPGLVDPSGHQVSKQHGFRFARIGYVTFPASLLPCLDLVTVLSLEHITTRDSLPTLGCYTVLRHLIRKLHDWLRPWKSVARSKFLFQFLFTNFFFGSTSNK